MNFQVSNTCKEGDAEKPGWEDPGALDKMTMLSGIYHALTANSIMRAAVSETQTLSSDCNDLDEALQVDRILMKANSELAPEQKKLKRIMANRKSAKESRERRKLLLAKLQVSVKSLTEVNRLLKQENQRLYREIDDLSQQITARTSNANLMNPTLLRQLFPQQYEVPHVISGNQNHGGSLSRIDSIQDHLQSLLDDHTV
jgi:hypothetical protein